MSDLFCVVDDKHIPVYRVIWVSDIPHFCGNEDCGYEGQYEIRLEQGESIWGSRNDRDKMIEAIENWSKGSSCDEPWD